MKFIHDQQCEAVTKDRDCTCGLSDRYKLGEMHNYLSNGGVEREVLLDLLEFLIEKVKEARR